MSSNFLLQILMLAHQGLSGFSQDGEEVMLWALKAECVNVTNTVGATGQQSSSKFSSLESAKKLFYSK